MKVIKQKFNLKLLYYIIFCIAAISISFTCGVYLSNLSCKYNSDFQISRVRDFIADNKPSPEMGFLIYEFLIDDFNFHWGNLSFDQNLERMRIYYFLHKIYTGNQDTERALYYKEKFFRHAEDLSLDSIEITDFGPSFGDVDANIPEG